MSAKTHKVGKKMTKTRTQTILVPLDGSNFAECALPVALSIARRLDGRVGLVSVSSKKRGRRKRSVTTISPNDVNLIDEVVSDYLNGVAARISESSSVPVFSTVLGGRPAAALAKHAKGHHPELIVMSTHGRGAFSRHWLGSVTEWMVRHVRTPVLVVRPEPDCEVRFDDKRQFRCVLVPLDGSKLSEQSLQWAKLLGGREAQYHLVRVTPDSISAWSDQPQAVTRGTTDLAAVAHDDAVGYLHGVKCGFEKGGLTVKTVIEDTVPTAVGILDTAERESADLVVITTHGRGGLRRLVLGSVADKVIRGSHVPVFVVKPADE